MAAKNLLLNFGLAFVAILFFAAVARWIAGSFTSVPRARVASFSVALGYALGKYSFNQRSGPPMEVRTALGLGAIAALVGLWFVLFRKEDDLSA